MGIFTKKVQEVRTSKKETRSKRLRLTVIGLVLVALLALLLDYPKVWYQGSSWLNQKTGMELLPPSLFDVPFKLGLDLQGGTHLIYEADLSNIEAGEYGEAMEGVRDVIERRINLFGVSEPVVQVNKAGSSYRLIVELAGVKDTHRAIEMIGQTPSLIFKKERNEGEIEKLTNQAEKLQEKIKEGAELSEQEQQLWLKFQDDPFYNKFEVTNLTGRYLKDAQVQFGQQVGKPQVALQFNDEGADIFKKLTEENIGKQVAIYLDGAPISAPVVQEAIPGGKAQISGNFSIQEAKQLVQRLNAGALPVPIDLISQQTVGATLGEASLQESLKAALWGFAVLLIFIIAFYRLPGLLASFALIIYVLLVLAIFKLIPVTLTLAGIAGFILSMGMAVDANILVFERFKEERRNGKSLPGSIEDSFVRAWPAIRDGSISTIITCIVLYIFTTSLIRGFALTLGIGVLMSMFTAMVVTKNFMRSFAFEKLENIKGLWR